MHAQDMTDNARTHKAQSISPRFRTNCTTGAKKSWMRYRSFLLYKTQLTCSHVWFTVLLLWGYCYENHPLFANVMSNRNTLVHLVVNIVVSQMRAVCVLPPEQVYITQYNSIITKLIVFRLS